MLHTVYCTGALEIFFGGGDFDVCNPRHSSSLDSTDARGWNIKSYEVSSRGCRLRLDELRLNKVAQVDSMASKLCPKIGMNRNAHIMDGRIILQHTIVYWWGLSVCKRLSPFRPEERVALEHSRIERRSALLTSQYSCHWKLWWIHGFWYHLMSSLESVFHWYSVACFQLLKGWKAC